MGAISELRPRRAHTARTPYLFRHTVSCSSVLVTNVKVADSSSSRLAIDKNCSTFSSGVVSSASSSRRIHQPGNGIHKCRIRHSGPYSKPFVSGAIALLIFMAVSPQTNVGRGHHCLRCGTNRAAPSGFMGVSIRIERPLG